MGRKLHVGGGLLSCEIGPDGALIFDIAKGAVARHLLRLFHTIESVPEEVGLRYQEWTNGEKPDVMEEEER